MAPLRQSRHSGAVRPSFARLRVDVCGTPRLRTASVRQSAGAASTLDVPSCAARGRRTTVVPVCVGGLGGVPDSSGTVLDRI